MRRLIDPQPDEPDDDEDEFGNDAELIGLHGGGWSRRPGEDFMRCHEHGLAPGDH